jgi:uncharacterized Ntn-hydrolase superfamily protein
MLEDGRLPHEVIAALVRGDPDAGQRQLGVIDMAGRTAVHQPVNAGAESLYWGAVTGRFYACLGNTLAGRDVIQAMARAYEGTAGTLAERLLAALVAGDRAGGDHRGRLAAGIRVARRGHKGLWIEQYVDESDDAVEELARQFRVTSTPT